MLSDPEATLTVFAPKNSAFAALPDGAVASLLLPENQETLTSLLGKHVLGTTVPRTCLPRRLVRVSWFSGNSKEATAPSGRAANALFFGAKTVRVASGSESISATCGSAAPTAA